MYIQRILGFLLVAASSGSCASANVEVENAREDLARKLQVPLEQVKVIAQTEQTWSDASLGCPQQGMMYAQVISYGSKLVLEVQGRRYAYHSGAGRDYFYCPDPAPGKNPDPE